MIISSSPSERSIDLFGDLTTGRVERSSLHDPDMMLTGLASPARPLPRLPATDEEGDDIPATAT